MNPIILRVALYPILALLLAFCTLPTYARVVDFAITGKYILTLQHDGSVRLSTYTMWSEVMSLTNFADLPTPGKAKVEAITTTRDSTAVILTKNGALYALGKNATWHTIGRCKTGGNAYSLLAADTGHVYVVSTNGITNAKTGKTVYKTPGYDSAYKGKWSHPSAIYLSSANKIWIAFDYGEFGGSVRCFNTLTERYEPTNWRTDSMGLLPVQSFFEVKGQLYFSMGLQHMVKHGMIARLVGDSVANVFRSGPDVSHPPKVYDDGEYIGPAAFDSRKKQLVFYSQSGFYIGELNTDLSQYRMWMKIASPQLQWKNGRSDAVGSTMAVSKIKYVGPGQFFFQTQGNGLGFYGYGAVRFFDF